MKNINKIIMHPTRLRIIQELALRQEATTQQIREDLSDISSATLYRQMKVLEEANFILVIRENKIRGTVEKVYALNPNPPQNTNEPEQINQMIQAMLLSLMNEFDQYFKRDDINPVKDQIAVTSSVLLLSDEEFNCFMNKLGEVFKEVLENKPNEERKVRKITFVSSPNKKET